MATEPVPEVAAPIVDGATTAVENALGIKDATAGAAAAAADAPVVNTVAPIDPPVATPPEVPAAAAPETPVVDAARNTSTDVSIGTDGTGDPKVNGEAATVIPPAARAAETSATNDGDLAGSWGTADKTPPAATAAPDTAITGRLVDPAAASQPAEQIRVQADGQKTFGSRTGPAEQTQFQQQQQANDGAGNQDEPFSDETLTPGAKGAYQKAYNDAIERDASPWQARRLASQAERDAISTNQDVPDDAANSTGSDAAKTGRKVKAAKPDEFKDMTPGQAGEKRLADLLQKNPKASRELQQVAYDGGRQERYAELHPPKSSTTFGQVMDMAPLPIRNVLLGAAGLAAVGFGVHQINPIDYYMKFNANPNTNKIKPQVADAPTLPSAANGTAPYRSALPVNPICKKGYAPPEAAPDYRPPGALPDQPSVKPTAGKTPVTGPDGLFCTYNP
jgi:hypothetical protein